MTNPDLVGDYYDWLVSIIDNDEYQCDWYQELLHKLYSVKFRWTIPMDENRAEDGMDLRDKFLRDNELKGWYQSDAFPYYPTVLEVLVALACRMEDDILFDPEYGDRTWEWFWMMMQNLGLDEMDDSNFDEDEVDEILDIFMDRRYGRDGKGSLFPSKIGQKSGEFSGHFQNQKWSESGQFDLSRVEIWYQMNYYIEENS